MGIDGHPGGEPSCFDLVNVTMQMNASLQVNGQGLSPRIRKGIHVTTRVFDHQMNIQRQRSDGTNRPYHRLAKTDIRHKIPVHHIQMQPIGTCLLHLLDLLGQTAKISG